MVVRQSTKAVTAFAALPVAAAGSADWYFHQLGTPLSPDLLGDDRPQDVARHYATEKAWLAGQQT